MIKNISRCVTLDVKFPGDLVYVLGETRNELGGSEYYQMMDSVGLQVPQVDLKGFWPQYLALHRTIQEGLVTSCHAVSRGGLAVHLAMVSIAGELGMDIRLPLIPAAQGLTVSQMLYSESCGRFIITISPERKERFEDIFFGLKIEQVGVVTELPRLLIKEDREHGIIEEDLLGLKDAWKRPFEDLI